MSGIRNRLQAILKQTLVNSAHVAHRQVTVVHELTVHSGKHVDGLLKMAVSHGVFRQKGVRVRVEEAAIEGCCLKWRAAIYSLEKIL